MILLECPYCSAHLEIGEGRGGRTMTCPFCKGQVDVPKPHKPRRQEEYGLEDDDGSMDGSRPSIGRLTAAEIAALEDDESPKKKRRRPKMEWHLFLGGFGFPWSPGAVLQWLLIAIWGTVAGGLFHSAIALGIHRELGGADISQNILALLAALGAVVFGLCCAGITAIYSLTILLETTSGNDHMENWPNVGLFLEWVGQLWFIFNPAAVSMLLAFGLDWLVPGILSTRELTVSLTVFFTFPIFLLCTLEADSPFVPVSAVVLASLWQHGIAWLLFFIQAGCLLAAAAALCYSLAPRLEPKFSIPLAALLLSAVIMIYFRLLGRLAFYCSVDPEEDEEEE